MTSISLDPSGGFRLTIPSATAEGRSHSVIIPLTLVGLSLLKKTLSEREKDIKAAKLGTLGSPTQAMCDAWLAAKTSAEKTKSLQPELAKKARSSIEEKYGIALADLDLDL